MKHALLLAAALATSANAQRIASDAEVARGMAACTAAIRGHLKDPDSARFKPPVAGMVKDRRVFIDVGVNAKNSYGGYAGEERWGCWLEEGTFTMAKLIAPGGYVREGK